MLHGVHDMGARLGAVIIVLAIFIIVLLQVLERKVSIQSLVVLDRLDASLVVILVDLLVHGGGDVLMLMRVDVLLGDGAPDVLVNAGLVLAVLGQEAGSGLLGFLHCDGCRVVVKCVCIWW